MTRRPRKVHLRSQFGREELLSEETKDGDEQTRLPLPSMPAVHSSNRPLFKEPTAASLPRSRVHVDGGMPKAADTLRAQEARAERLELTVKGVNVTKNGAPEASVRPGDAADSPLMGLHGLSPGVFERNRIEGIEQPRANNATVDGFALNGSLGDEKEEPQGTTAAPEQHDAPQTTNPVQIQHDKDSDCIVVSPARRQLLVRLPTNFPGVPKPMLPVEGNGYVQDTVGDMHVSKQSNGTSSTSPTRCDSESPVRSFFDNASIKAGAPPSPTEEASSANVSEMGRSKQKTSAPVSQVSEPTEATLGALTAALYGRERNPRRHATKLYRTPTASPKQRGRPSTREQSIGQQTMPVRTSPADEATLVKGPDMRSNPRKRSPPDEDSNPKKRRRSRSRSSRRRNRRSSRPALSSPYTSQSPLSGPEASHGQSPLDHPVRDVGGDQLFVERVRADLKQRVNAKTSDMGKRQARRILELLEMAEYPTENEALFLTTEQASQQVASGFFWNSIIVTCGQQTLPLQTIEQFLNEYYEDDTMVWIQDPAVRPSRTAPITRQVKMRQVKERLAKPPTDKPWNLLELATHCDDGLRPTFLNTEDCRLLTKLKIPDAADHARRRVYEPGYKEVEKWSLLAEAGALTEPHQDSHGYSTFITINVGHVGFGWLSAPSDDERKAWCKRPATFTGGHWRYVVLKPGQTVYFPAGTVHFVFRLPSAGNTLAFGGHILRCSNLVHWVRTLLEERDSSSITNEDLTDSATGYLARVEKFVRQARLSGTVGKWGGEEEIVEFLRLKGEFEKKKQRKG